MIVAIVPAAGRSLRMGQPKLLMEVDGQPVIARVVAALRSGGADRVVVVAPPHGRPESAHILRLARGAGAFAVALSEPTDDMRATLEQGLALASDLDGSILGVLIAPGDAVGMTQAIVAAVVDRFQSDPTRIVRPVLGPKRGHPLALPWDLAWSLRGLEPGQGMNALIRERADLDTAVEVDDPTFANDLDTPEDYRRLTDL